MHNTVTIKIGGKKRIFKYNVNSDAIICEGMSELLGRPVVPEEFFSFMFKEGVNEKGELSENDNVKYRSRFLIWMFYAGIHNHLESQGKAEEIEKITYHKIADWLTETPQEDQNQVLETFIRVLIPGAAETNNGQKRKGEATEKKN